MNRMITISAFLMLVACSSNKVGDNGPDGGDVTADAPRANVDAPPSGVFPTTIFTIVLENKNDESVIGSANAPYLNSLLAQGGLATNYKDTNHPSLPNYLHMISGADQYPGIIDIGPNQAPYFPADKPNLGTQLEAAQINWRSYQESMGTPCKLTDSGLYATKHDPFIYFKDGQTDPVCSQRNVDYAQFPADLAAGTYRYMWITPNLESDGHNPTSDPVAGLQHADAWMSVEVPKILASDAYKNGGILFITWDEDEGMNNEKVPMIILSPRIAMVGMSSDTSYDHGSYLATVEDLLGLQRLQTVSSAPTMMEFFNP